MGDFGGLLYAYSDMKVVFWIPQAVNGHIINIGGVYNSMYNQASNNVNITIKMFTFSFQGICFNFVFVIKLLHTVLCQNLQFKKQS